MVLKDGTRIAVLAEYLRENFNVSLNLREGRQVSTACLRKEKFKKQLTVSGDTTVGEVCSFVGIFNLSIDLISPHGDTLPNSVKVKNASEYINTRKSRNQFTRQLEVVEALLDSTAYEDADIMLDALEKSGRLIEGDQERAIFFRILEKVEHANNPVTDAQLQSLKTKLGICE